MNNKLRNLFLVAFTLVFASCMSEVADPADNADVLGGNVAAVVEQVEVMEASIADVKAVKESLSNVSGLENVNEFKSQLDVCVSAIESHIASVQGGMSALDATLAAMQLQAEIAEVIGAIKAHVGELSAIATLEKGVKSWIGDKFENYYLAVSEYAMVKEMSAIVEAQKLSVDALVSDVEAGLRAEDTTGNLAKVETTVAKSSNELSEIIVDLESLCSELESGYETAIQSSSSDAKKALKSINTKASQTLAANDNTLSGLFNRIEACEADLEKLNGRLEKVEADVEALLGMIQSITFLSDYSEDYAYAYYNMDVNTKVSDESLPYYGKAQRTATGNMELTYMVRPAAAAKALNANIDAVKVIGFYAQSIETRAPQATDYIELEVTKVALVSEARGMVTVTVKPNFRDAFYYKEIGAKCALSVVSANTDITSRFVEIVPKDNSTTVYATGVTPSRTSIEFDKGESISLSAVVTPSNAVQVCHWTSSNNEIAYFDGSTLKAEGVGNTTVKVTTSAVDEWGLPLVAEIPVKVNEAFRLAGPPYIEVGYTAEMLLTKPVDATILSTVWKSSDPSKLTVDENGKVTAVAHTYNDVTNQYNDVTISCEINGVTTVSCNLFVAAIQPKAIVTPALSNGQSEITMRVDESISLSSTISPENVPAGVYRLIYQSDHDRFIDFNTGIINEYKNTLSPTSAYVYITVDNIDQEKYMVVGSPKKTILVKVLPYYVKTISFDPIEMQLGQTVKLSPKFTADVDGKTPTNTAVTWRSLNPNVASVDENGVVTSNTSGKVTIVATAQDGSNVSGACNINITQPWKSFEIGDYVVRTGSGDIEFGSDLNTAKNKGTIVGVVVAKTNPRASDPMLPESCTHGVAVALGESSEVTWWSSAPSSSPYKLYEWATQNGYLSTMGVDWSSSKQTYLTGTYDKFVGYNNTAALQAFVANKGITSAMLDAVLSYRKSNGGPTLPNEASQYYLPSYAEMDAIATVSNNTTDLSNKLRAAGGTAFSNAYYWTASDSGNSSSQALKVNPITGDWAGNDQKTNKFRVRFVFAF